MWGSDLIAAALKGCGFEFAAINPGASYRGLHDSFVNYEPGHMDLVVCLHEEHAVAIAHGWSKVTGKPALAIVHSNVGLLHASMAVYNAWVDRAPVVVLGATGAMDAARRRPWIEWIHTVQDQAQILRPFTKWDDQPASPIAAARSIAHGAFLASQAPQGPVYICLDVTDQETRIDDGADAASLVAAPRMPLAGLSAEQVAKVVSALTSSRKPLFVFGRVSRDEDDWAARVALAKAVGARVMTDIKSAAAFPTDHPAHIGVTGFSPDAEQRAALGEADLILLFDPIDPATILTEAAKARASAKGGASGQGGAQAAMLFSVDHHAHRGWVKDGHALPGDIDWFPAPADAPLRPVLDALGAQKRDFWQLDGRATGDAPVAHSLAPPPVFARLAAALAEVRETTPLTITRLPLSWPGDLLPFRHPLDYLGRDGGEGLASGPGIAVGAALALKDSGRLPVAIVGDGDFMMGVSALWSAANQNLPLMIIVAANGVYGNDVVHQERIARERGRNVDNKWVGQMLGKPDLGIAQIADGLGAIEAVRMDAEADDLESVVRRLAAVALDGKGVVLLEVMMPARPE